MKIIVTSIGEHTTDLCVWSLQRQGFEVELIKDDSTLFDKLKRIYTNNNEDIIRVDADVICNKNVKYLTTLNEAWWYQGLMFDWFRQDIGHGGVQFIRKQCLPAIRQHINEAEYLERPESYLSRLAEFHNPRRFANYEQICGIHGFGQKDIQRIKDTKARRNYYEDYDWELAERIEAL